MSERDDLIGVIGVGLLGGALAERLLQQGYRVVGFDTDPHRAHFLTTLGGEAGGDAAEVFGRCSTVFLSLPTSATGLEVIDQQEPSPGEATTVLDTTTGDPEQMLLLRDRVERRGGCYLEANVAGSSQQLRDGLAVLLVGGSADSLGRVAGLLDSISEQVFHLGGVGSASRFKLIHNLILGLHRAVLAEGLALAESLGFDAAEVLRILQHTPAASAVMKTKGPKMVQADYEPQAKLAQHLKDVLLIRKVAQRAGAAVPLSEIHAELLQRAMQLGYSQADNSAVIEAYRQSALKSGGE